MRLRGSLGCGWESQDNHVDSEQKVQKSFFHRAAWKSKVPLSLEKHVEARRRRDNRTLIHQAQLHAHPPPPPVSPRYAAFFSSHLISFEGLGQQPVVDVFGHAGERAVHHLRGASLRDAVGDGLGVAAVGEREQLPVAHTVHLLGGQ